MEACRANGGGKSWVEGGRREVGMNKINFYVSFHLLFSFLPAIFGRAGIGVCGLVCRAAGIGSGPCRVGQVCLFPF